MSTVAPVEWPMREHRRRTIRQHDLAHEGFEIGVVFGEVAHIAFAGIAQRALRQALAAPIERRDGKAARAQIAHRLEIFFDPLAAALKNAPRCRCVRPAAASGQSASSRRRRFQRAGDEIVRNRIGGDRDEFHGTSSRSGLTLITVREARSTTQSRSRAASDFRRSGVAALPSIFELGIQSQFNALRPLAATEGRPHINSCAGRLRLRIHRLGPSGRAIRMSLKEDMPCELSI